MEDGSKLLLALLKASEKAANIARVCRQNKCLFDLLVQEKSKAEKNPAFVRDFKTLADVLIQETIKHDIGLEFPELSQVIQGEENNTFTNVLGETIIVEVCPTYQETTNLLAKVMGNDTEIAGLLANEVHKNIRLMDVKTSRDIPKDLSLPIEDLGIWIDPIGGNLINTNPECSINRIVSKTVVDATGEYVHPSIDEVEGLRCVAVLIGVYLKSTGLPVLGIVNKPFPDLHSYKQSIGTCYWGYYDSNSGTCRSNIIKDSTDNKEDTSKIILIGRSENEDLKTKLREAGFTLTEVAGAGHKTLSVALGAAAAYVLSKGSTYKWDTCATQAILRSVGGGIIDYQKFVENPDSDDLDLKYSTTSTNAANKGGLIAYRDIEVLRTLKKILC